MTLLVTVLIAVAVTLYVASACEIALMLRDAPEGYEDSGGFHEGKPPKGSDFEKWD